jgi:hypothetical protein
LDCIPTPKFGGGRLVKRELPARSVGLAVTVGHLPVDDDKGVRLDGYCHGV